MAKPLQASRDVIIQTTAWDEATRFYALTLGLPVVHRSPNPVGFEAGAFCLHVERGARPGPVFDFLVPDVAAAKARLIAAGSPSKKKIPRCHAATCAIRPGSSSISAWRRARDAAVAHRRPLGHPRMLRIGIDLGGTKIEASRSRRMAASLLRRRVVDAARGLSRDLGYGCRAGARRRGGSSVGDLAASASARQARFHA